MNREILKTTLTITGSIALGALTMYFFDPARGSRRRALCMGQLNNATHTVKDAVESTAHDLTNKARGILADAKSAIGSSPALVTEAAQSDAVAA